MSKYRDLAETVIFKEIDGLRVLVDHLDEKLDQAVEILCSTKGKVITMGVGKSGLIARKVSATLSSIGIPSYYISALDALHGDLGAIASGDTLIMISNSGKTDELMELLPSLQSRAVRIITITGDNSSLLAKNADVSLLTQVHYEACPYDIVPTSSTTAALVMGDVLAICCAEKNGFSPAAFKCNHPRGSLAEKIERDLKCKIKIAS